MKIFKRLFWLTTLVFFAGGCSSYKLAPYPGIEDEAAEAVEWESDVEVGNRVKVTLTDNSQVEGKVMEISPEAITLGPDRQSHYKKKRYGESQPRVIRVDRIQTLEIRVHSGLKTGFLVVSIVFGSIALAAVGFAASGGVPSMM